MSDKAKPVKTEAVKSPVSDDQGQALPLVPANTTQKPAQGSYSQPEPEKIYRGVRVPGTKRQRKFERQCEKAKAAIVSGTIEPKTREVAEHCQCAYRTALSILATLTTEGVIVRSGRCWMLSA